MELDIKSIFTLTFSESEFHLFLGGIGRTSINSRVDAGMTAEQAHLFAELYEKLGHLSEK